MSHNRPSNSNNPLRLMKETVDITVVD